MLSRDKIWLWLFYNFFLRYASMILHTKFQGISSKNEGVTVFFPIQIPIKNRENHCHAELVKGSWKPLGWWGPLGPHSPRKGLQGSMIIMSWILSYACIVLVNGGVCVTAQHMWACIYATCGVSVSRDSKFCYSLHASKVCNQNPPPTLCLVFLVPSLWGTYAVWPNKGINEFF